LFLFVACSFIHSFIHVYLIFPYFILSFWYIATFLFCYFFSFPSFRLCLHFNFLSASVLRLPEFLDDRYMKVARLSDIGTDRLYTQETSLVHISVRG
jgi:hypothetical protein